MPFKLSDWHKMCRRLATARDLLKQARDDEAQRELLDQAVWAAWTFAEYAINVLLELCGQKAEQHHLQADRAQELYGARQLKTNYQPVIEKLQKFRLKADYAGYSRSPSVHYSPHNVEECLHQLDALRLEVEDHLRGKGKLK